MPIDSFYTSSFALPNFPRVENIPSTSLCPGPDGHLGFVICHGPSDYGDFTGLMTNFSFVMLVIDVEHAHVEEHHFSLVYKAFYIIHLMYDAKQSTWLLVVDAVRDDGPIVQKLLDFYAVNVATSQPWMLVRRIKQTWGRRIDKADGIERIFVDWQPWFATSIEQKHVFTTLVKGHVNDDGLAEHSVQLVHAHTSENFTTHELRRGHRSISFVFDASILLFLCECPEETCTWNMCLSVFDVHGQQMALKEIIPVPYPARREKLWVADDLGDWLWPTMSVIGGPSSGPEQGKTCVAALQLRDQPEKERGYRRGKIRYAKEPLPEVQGGLFCIDPMGQIVAQQACVLGDALCMCVCGERVIGVDLMEGTWRLWSWSPLTINTFDVLMDLHCDAKRVTLIPVASDDQLVTPSFWLIAENEIGIQVSLWVGPDWQSKCHHHVEHVRLPHQRAQTQLEYKPDAIVASQDSLLVMVIDQAYRLQLLRFQ